MNVRFWRQRSSRTLIMNCSEPHLDGDENDQTTFLRIRPVPDPADLSGDHVRRDGTKGLPRRPLLDWCGCQANGH